MLTIAAVLADNNDNPFNGVKPNFNWLGPDFSAIWVPALGGALGIALIVLAFFLIKAIVDLRNARNNRKPDRAEHAMNQIVGTSIAIAATALLPTIFGMILYVAHA